MSNRMKQTRTAAYQAHLLLLTLTMLLLGTACGTDDGQIQSRLLSEPAVVEGFSRVEGPSALTFPADHGSHDAYQTEWWYFTGNLDSNSGRHFGYQLTFFRRALLPEQMRASDRPSAWKTDHIYMAHFALTDVDGDSFKAEERFSRGAAGLAGVETAPFSVWLEDWQVVETSPDSFSLHASQEGRALTLELVDVKGVVLQGEQGYSQKGPEPGNASTYYSLTRLQSSGQIEIGGETFQVTGSSWMDHEYSTSALSAGQVGWDWFSVQLDDGSELMLFQIRRDDGSVDPFSSGTLILADSTVINLNRDAFEIAVEEQWRSPHSDAEYPAQWTITIPGHELTLSLKPYLADQELMVSYAYWEGAVRVNGSRSGQPVSGVGYVELTGYSRSMEGEF